MNRIHPTAIIAKSVVIGTDNVIGPYCVIDGDVTIGDGNWFGSHVTIGTPAQHSVQRFELGDRWPQGITIGSRVVLREYVTVEHPANETTTVHDDVYAMAYAHISHDCVVRKGTILCHNVQMGGFTSIGAYSNIGLSVMTHQGTTIGGFTMIGMGTVVSKDVPPFAKAFGNPIQLEGLNVIGLERAGFDREAIKQAELFLTRDMPPKNPRLYDAAVNYETERKRFARKALSTS